jgi:hypothetical protein
MSKNLHPSVVTACDEAQLRSGLIFIYEELWKRLEALGFQQAQCLKMPEVVSGTLMSVSTPNLYLGYEPSKSTVVLALGIVQAHMAIPHDLIITPYLKSTDTGLWSTNSIVSYTFNEETTEVLYKAVLKKLGWDSTVLLEEMLVNLPNLGQDCIALYKAASIGFLTKKAVVDTWNAIKQDFKNACYGAQGHQGNTACDKAKDYLVQHPFLLNNIAKDMKGVVAYEKEWVKPFLKNTCFMFKS